ncbi:metal ion channel-Mg2+, Co2+ and Ni2+, putative [Plasmodium relictum]|uniref:Magnesium transporter n=1 Tax=Plasmodium relictum TaxID=85471 RepID=A0A1J1H581_PLARL|nr:metal ion channel-Mg2+, Co2+ and Ni2+, putative [Plasmodium relictum]CRH00071.1 metal ion channel-Mg2+, Co2+ and Ni2+, putative [Plasmodium relictum]
MIEWTYIKKYKKTIINPIYLRSKTYIPQGFLSKYTTVKNENKIYSKKNFNNILMQNLKITEDEKIVCEKVYCSKYNLPYILKIPFSDLRLIDTYNNNHNPTILVRKNVIMLRTGFISCIIRFNELWLFEPNNPLVIKAINLIKENFKKKWNLKIEECTDYIRNYSKGKCDDNLEDKKNDEKEDINYLNVKNNFYRYNANNIFEFLCLDICMQLSIKEYENDIDKINGKIREKIQLQRKEENNEINMLTNKLLRDMMKIKNNLQKLSNLLNALRSNIEKILKDNNDMKNMYLTFLHNNKYINQLKDYSDLEILLETHLQLTDELYGELENIEEKITHYEELMRLNLDYNRNKFILLNVKISFATLFCSICSVITSLFGMNLKNFIENNDYAFFIVSIFISFWSLIGIYFTKNINTLLKFFDKYKIK